MKEDRISQIAQRLKALNPYKAILFGSWASGVAVDESDIDLVIVLDVEGMPKSFSERMKNHSRVRSRLRSINREVPMDVLVYTKAEWNQLMRLNTSFAREILKTGRAIL